MSQRAAAIKRAELLSGLGAGVLGAGLALLVPQLLAPYAAWLLVSGVVAHGVGMTLKHRLERAVRVEAPWERWLFWGCWAILAAIAVAVAWQLRPQSF